MKNNGHSTKINSFPLSNDLGNRNRRHLECSPVILRLNNRLSDVNEIPHESCRSSFQTVLRRADTASCAHLYMRHAPPMRDGLSFPESANCELDPTFAQEQNFRYIDVDHSVHSQACLPQSNPAMLSNSTAGIAEPWEIRCYGRQNDAPDMIRFIINSRNTNDARKTKI